MSGRRRGRPPERIGNLLEKELPRADQMLEARIYGAFLAALPPRVTDAARPVRFQHGVLWVHAKSASWAQELEFLGADLLARVRARLPRVRIASIRFRVGPLPDLPELVAPPPPAPPAMPVAALPEDVGRALTSLRDDALRTAVADAARQSLGRDAVSKTR